MFASRLPVHYRLWNQPPQVLFVDPREERRHTLCPISTTYDEAHAYRFGNNCDYKHNFYHWQGLVDNRVGLIGDSLVKYIRGVRHLEIQSVPGLNLGRALEMMTTGELRIVNFEVLVLMIGTNDLGSCYMTICRKMNEILRFLQYVIPATKLAVGLILPRPGDTGIHDDEHRRRVNSELRFLCKDRGVVFLNTYIGVTSYGIFDTTLYARDMLHLNWRGVQRMGMYLKGAAGTLLDPNFVPTPRCDINFNI